MSEPTDDLLITGHDYDGIQELDNALPTWWLYLFYLTVAFGFAYVVYFHAMDNPSSHEAYAAEVAAAESANPPPAPGDAPDEAAVAAVNAGQVFMTSCMPCHGPDGRGIIGPNLTDDHWIHGCSKADIVAIISKGVPEKGMIAWSATLKPAEIHALADYILDMRGTTPESPKAPEGVPCGDGAAPVETPTAPAQPTVAESAATAAPAAPAASTEGSKIFMTNCMPCHGPDGRGIVGPNLTDEHWIHGCSKEDIIALINKGVPEKGMISWKPVLTPQQIDAVTDHILTLVGTTPENPKAPEGEICKSP